MAAERGGTTDATNGTNGQPGPTARVAYTRSLARLTSVLLGCAAASCGDQGPVSGAGVLTATLASPHGAEGAAVVELMAEGLGEVTALGDTQAHAYAAPGRTRVVLVHPSGGTLAFRVEVEDMARPPAWVVREVAAPDDGLRTNTAAYTLELRP